MSPLWLRPNLTTRDVHLLKCPKAHCTGQLTFRGSLAGLAAHRSHRTVPLGIESSVYRILKAHGLITSPTFVVITVADHFSHPSTRPNELWQTGGWSRCRPRGIGTTKGVVTKVYRTPHPRRSAYSRLFRTEPNPEKVLLLSDEHIK